MPAFSLSLFRCGSIPGEGRVAPVEAVVDAGLDGVLGVGEPGTDNVDGTGQEGRAAEIVVLVFELGGPARREHVFEAGADGVAILMVVVGGEGRRCAAGNDANIVVILPGITALGIEQGRAEGVAEPT